MLVDDLAGDHEGRGDLLAPPSGRGCAGCRRGCRSRPATWARGVELERAGPERLGVEVDRDRDRAAVRSSRSSCSPPVGLCEHSSHPKVAEPHLEPDRRVDRPRLRDRHAQAIRDLDHRAREAVELERLAGLEVLQHRRLVVADRDSRLRAAARATRAARCRARRRPPRTPPSSRARSSTHLGRAPSSPSVAPVSASIGLKTTLPISFSQICSRICSSTGHLSPPATERLGDRLAAVARSPSGSPIAKRVPSTCRTTPGSTSSVAGVGHAADHALRRDRAATTPPGSTLSSDRAVELVRRRLEEPPRHAVLRRDHRRVAGSSSSPSAARARGCCRP